MGFLKLSESDVVDVVVVVTLLDGDPTDVLDRLHNFLFPTALQMNEPADVFWD